jgi:hypothetical protein
MQSASALKSLASRVARLQAQTECLQELVASIPFMNSHPCGKTTSTRPKQRHDEQIEVLAQRNGSSL